jgi:predicted acyl esterase
VVALGPASVDLWLRSSAPDTDLEVTITEVRPDGKETYVQSGWLRASARKLDPATASALEPRPTYTRADASPLPAGRFSLARVEVFPFGHVFRAGSRIRLAVQAPGGNRPRWEFASLPARGRVVNQIARSGVHPSRVVLPVVPGIAVRTGLPECGALRGQPCRDYAVPKPLG